MSFWRQLTYGLRGLLRRRERENEIDAEVQNYFEEVAAAYREHGLSEEDARRAARRECGNLQAEKEQVYQAWQKSEEQLQHAMQTIDQMAEQPAQARSALVKAKQFYEQILAQEGPPARVALAHYRLGKIHERLGDHRAAHESYQEAIARWEKMARDGGIQAESQHHLQDGRERLQALAGR